MVLYIVRQSEECERAKKLWAADKHEEALALFTRLAAAGDPHAQSRLVNLYRDGREHVARDFGRCRYWLDRMSDVAEAGNVDAQMILFGWYQMEPLVADDDLAAYWLLKAAEAGDPEAQYEVWGNAETVFPGPRELAARQAQPWLEKAAAQGYAEAMYHLSRQYFAPDGRPSERALELISKAAEQGLPPAVEYLAWLKSEPNARGSP